MVYLKLTTYCMTFSGHACILAHGAIWLVIESAAPLKNKKNEEEQGEERKRTVVKVCRNTPERHSMAPKYVQLALWGPKQVKFSHNTHSRALNMSKIHQNAWKRNG